MAVIYDRMVANGSYTNKDGEDKTSWLKIGRVMTTQKGGFVMKLDCIPTFSINQEGNTTAWEGWAQMFKPRPKEGKQQAAPQVKPQDDGFDDIPF